MTELSISTKYPLNSSIICNNYRKMKILFISTDCIAIGLAHKLVKEGNDVKLFIEEEKK